MQPGNRAETIWFRHRPDHVTNRFNVINFAGLFSGTAVRVVAPQPRFSNPACILRRGATALMLL